MARRVLLASFCSITAILVTTKPGSEESYKAHTEETDARTKVIAFAAHIVTLAHSLIRCDGQNH